MIVESADRYFVRCVLNNAWEWLGVVVIDCKSKSIENHNFYFISKINTISILTYCSNTSAEQSMGIEPVFPSGYEPKYL